MRGAGGRPPIPKQIGAGLFGRLPSKASDSWETPPELYAALDEEFHFTHDAASELHNRKAVNGFGDALTEPWSGRVFCNPPYSECAAWAKKVHEEWKRGSMVVLLLPAWTDRDWFHQYVYGHAELRFIRGRLTFVRRGVDRGGHAPYPSMLAIFRPECA